VAEEERGKQYQQSDKYAGLVAAEEVSEHTGQWIRSAIYLWPVKPENMQQISFAIGHFLEDTFKILSAMGWMPVIGISIVLGLGFLYWMNLQAKYSRKAQKDGTLI